MANEKKKNRKPAITLSRSDSDRLARLAEAYLGQNPEVAAELLTELDRARIVGDGRLNRFATRCRAKIQTTLADGGRQHSHRLRSG